MLDDKYKKKKPCVYFITDGEFVKIGVSKCLVNRFLTLQSTNPRELSVMTVIYTKNTYETESFYHKKYQDKRIRGEWFDIKAEIEKEIEESRKKQLEEELRKEKERAEAKVEAKKNKYKDYYTFEELATALRVSLRMVKRMAALEDFPTVKKIGGVDRLKKEAFKEFLDERIRKGIKKII